MQRLYVALFATSLLVACGGDDSSRKDDMAAGGSTDMAMAQTGGDMEPPPTGPCTAGTSDCAAVATSVFNSDFTGMGTLDTVQLSTKKATTNIDATLDGDTTLKVYDNELYVLMRDTGSVRIYDPATYKVKVELPTAATLGASTSGSTYPEDFYVDSAGKIWVTLSGNPSAQAVGILDRTQPGVLSYVTIPTVAGDTDGNPEANKLYPCGSNLWVTQQSFMYGSNSAITYQKGSLVAMNLTTKTVGTTIPLLYKDPSDITAVAADCTDALVVSSSSTTSSPDGTGGLERVNLTAGTTASVATDTTLGGRPVYVVNTSNYAFVAEYFDPEQDSSGDTFLSSVKIVAYDLTAGTLHGDVTGKFGNISFLQLNGGNLYFGAGVFSATQDPTKLPAGLYITPADGTALTASPINLQLTPSAIALP